MLKKIAIRALAFASLSTALLLAPGAAQAAVPVYGFFIKNTYPHDPKAFTEGLFFRDGYLYESTGMNGQSSVRKVELASGKVVQKTDLPANLFGEGIAPVGGDIVGLTWTTQVGFVFDLKTFRLKRKFKYEGEGWGLTSDAKHVYRSDGSDVIRILDPATLKEERRISVTADGKPITRLNELELVEGELYANVWGTDVIVRIDPATGNVTGLINLKGLLDWSQRGTESADAVLNGIAYDAKSRRLFVTGKMWPKLFEIELVPMQKQ
jgi:glutamine cyclotransferase